MNLGLERRVALVTGASAGLMKTLSVEVAASGVTVNAAATGRFVTDRLLALYDHDRRVLDEAARLEVPMRRAGTVEELSPVVAFLCSERSRYVTGQTVAVDGGYIRALF